MSPEFIAYFLIAGTACLLALLIVRPRRAFDLSRMVGWYLLVFFLCYLLRPVGSQLLGDTLLYDTLRIGTIEDHWQLMSFAVSLAILCFAVGYRIAAGPAIEAPPDRLGELPGITAAEASRKVMWVVLVWGYLLFIIAFGTGQVAGDSADVAGTSMGTYTHNTAWFMQSDLFVSSGTTLYYILTGDLRSSLLLAAPWLVGRLSYGWGRTFIIGHFFALMGVYFIRARFRARAKPKFSQVVLIGLAIIVTLLLFPMMASLRALKQQMHLSATSLSKDALMMAGAGVSPQDMVQSYFGTNSSICGFEESLYHLLTDHRPQWGIQYLYVYFFQPIPRIIWPGKGSPYEWPLWLLGIDWDPIPAAMGMAPGSIGMAFQQWGWLGIPLEFLFTGWFFGWIEERIRRRPGAVHLQLAYAGFFSALPQAGRETWLYLIAQKWLFMYGIPVFILWRIYERQMAYARSSRRRKYASQAIPSVPIATGS